MQVESGPTIQHWEIRCAHSSPQANIFRIFTSLGRFHALMVNQVSAAPGD